MTDCDLLELAAKAADIGIWWCDQRQSFYRAGYQVAWNPLIDDGDALRLAVKLSLRVHVDIDCITKSIEVNYFDDGSYCHTVSDQNFDDAYAATRHSIVRAAAELGKMKG